MFDNSNTRLPGSLVMSVTQHNLASCVTSQSGGSDREYLFVESELNALFFVYSKKHFVPSLFTVL